MHTHACNMHKYENGIYTQICTNMKKYAKNIQEICRYMQHLKLVSFSGSENTQEISKIYAVLYVYAKYAT